MPLKKQSSLEVFSSPFGGGRGRIGELADFIF
jgi:hypothetical protein